MTEIPITTASNRSYLPDRRRGSIMAFAWPFAPRWADNIQHGVFFFRLIGCAESLRGWNAGED
jgi:hypothetical protein